MSAHKQGLVIECPTCKSSAKRCKRPSGHEAPEWHATREDAYAEVCGCAECCQPWLARKAAK